eukprot:CAMPEP_0171072202 /NCGR_PEP_ID=MMETSP0766_2-20121228/10721_1 /TAXON_ID=439317 /ORGANISM="Gambierdiscus australes, Strain CAWD 149" /LENGTH=303 /DNA_ID=CAMNT_0011528771 /DNA_START=82 /DNA_END=993 /DNA_ORIENTATION=+
MATAPLLVSLVLFLAAPALAEPTMLEAIAEASAQDDFVHLLQEHAEVHDRSKAQAALETRDRSAAVEAGQTAGSVSSRAVVAEFIAMALFVFFGCGSAMSIAKEEGSAWVLQVSLTFGLAITVLAYTIGHISGAQINCAVTLGLVIYGHVPFWQGVCNFVAQMLGSLLGAMVLKTMYPGGKDLTGGLATNSVSPGWTTTGALIGEFVGTFLLMFVVFQTAVNDAAAANNALAPLAIGLSVFLAHSVLIPVDGCSINPTRTFGPALVHSVTGGGMEAFSNMWVFWLGPLAGAAAAAGVYALMAL